MFDGGISRELNELETSIGEITQLLNELDQGDPGAEEALFRRQYSKLRKLASNVVGACGGGLTLQTTDVLHEFYIRFRNQEPIKCNDTEHFLQIARKKMREVVWDYARSRKAAKRPPAQGKVALDDVLTDLRHNGLATADVEPEQLLFLKQLLEKLEAFNQRDSDMVDLYYFIGLSHADIGKRYNLAEDSVKKRLQFIRAWLSARAKELDDRRGTI